MNQRIISALLVLTALFGATAQNTTSPYSRFGFGLLSDNATSAQNQMGGVGYAMVSGRQVNVMNPAAYANTDSLTFLFDMGLSLAHVWYKDGDASRKDTGGGLDYITMQFPVGNRFGMSLALLPYSSVGYSFGSEIENGSSTHSGTGGLNLLNVGFSGRIFQGFSAGFNFGYLFGTTYNDVYARNNTSTALFEQVVQVRDFHYQFGLMYARRLNKHHRVSAGVTFAPGKRLLGHSWIQKYIVGSEQAPDTLNYMSLKNHYSLPPTWGAGVAWGYDGRVEVEADFTYQPWSKAKLYQDDNFTSTRYADRWKVALGASFQPAVRGNYFQRITYRLGGHFTRDYVMVDNNHIKEYGIAGGFGFPTANGKTIINLGFEYLRREASPQKLVTENYFNIRLGINFNQLWFQQSKIR